MLKNFDKLKNNWDGYGALEVEQESHLSVKKLFSSGTFNLFPESNIFPNPNGTITIEWENNSGYANLEVGNKLFTFFVEFSNNEYQEESGNNSTIVSKIIYHLTKLYYLNIL